MTARIAFVHLVRTAGTYVSARLGRTLHERAAIHNSWFEGLARDWTRREMLDFARAGGSMFVHNHVVSWDRDLVRAYRAAGFVTFALVRDVGDQLCSLWHLIERQSGTCPGAVDRFVREQLDGGEIEGYSVRDWAVPEWWGDLDHVDSIDVPGWQHRLETRLGLAGEVTWSDSERVNVSGNLGIDQLVATGAISATTLARVQGSPYAGRVRSIEERREVRG